MCEKENPAVTPVILVSGRSSGKNVFNSQSFTNILRDSFREETGGNRNNPEHPSDWETSRGVSRCGDSPQRAPGPNEVLAERQCLLILRERLLRSRTVGHVSHEHERAHTDAVRGGTRSLLKYKYTHLCRKRHRTDSICL